MTLPTPTPEPKGRPAWVVGGVTIVSFVALLWVIELWDSLTNHRLDSNGIRLPGGTKVEAFVGDTRCGQAS